MRSTDAGFVPAFFLSRRKKSAPATRRAAAGGRTGPAAGRLTPGCTYSQSRPVKAHG